ncbi:MAG: GxxExxY protein [Opitutales bacterium]
MVTTKDTKDTKGEGLLNLDCETERIARVILDAAFEVHTHLGPGLLESAYEAQVISYLKLSGYRVAFLINFHSNRLKDGLRRFVN